MKHPEMLLLPVLMLCDYYLTVVGFVLYRKGYRNRVKIDQYELNPLWQASISKVRWFNPRHLAIVALVTGAVFFLVEYIDSPPETVAFLFGVVFMASAVLVSRHIANILFFTYAIRHPEQFSGEVHIGHEMTLKTSQCHVLAALLPLILIAVFVPSPFVIGSVVSVLMLLLVHSLWLRKYRRKKAKEQAAASAQEPPKRDESET